MFTRSLFSRFAIGALVFFLCGAAVSVPLAAEPPAPVMAGGEAAAGSAAVAPDEGISGEFGTWTVTFIAGEGGIGEGGGIRVQLPDTWHAGPRNSAIRLQATDPAAAHFVSARVSRSGVTVETVVESETEQELVKHAKDSLDGRWERYVFVVRVWIAEGRLEEGERIEVIYGDREGGSPGMPAAAIATDPEPILIAVDAKGDGRFRLLDSAPRLQAFPAEPVELMFHAPSHAVPGEPVRMLVSALDRQFNAVDRAMRIAVTGVTGEAEFPATVEMPEGKGYVYFEATPTATGVLRLRAEALGLSAVSNPTDVTEAPPERMTLWGDLHSHARHSWDGVGDQSFHYARHIAGLDFYALTDHSIAPHSEDRTRGLSEYTWEEYTALTDKYHSPPEFITIHGYEASFGRPYGHHNVYFRDRPGPLLYPQSATLEEFWEVLEAGDALTIPHHTGKFPRGIDFGRHDPAFRRNFEIYSGHGLSENYDPDHALSFENSVFTSPSRSLDEPTFARDVWVRGLELSSIASSDDHRGQPGQPHYGLAAIRAPERSREAIFHALHDRHTYGTSGARILLEFSLNGVPMGQRVGVASPPLLRVRALGISPIERVELLKWQPPMEQFEVIRTWRPNELDFEGEHRDEDHAPGAVYYIRLRETEKIRGLPVKAWSSPIWTEASTGPGHSPSPLESLEPDA